VRGISRAGGIHGSGTKSRVARQGRSVSLFRCGRVVPPACALAGLRTGRPGAGGQARRGHRHRILDSTSVASRGSGRAARQAFAVGFPTVAENEQPRPHPTEQSSLRSICRSVDRSTAPVPEHPPDLAGSSL
jgi:hypothetical protein